VSATVAGLPACRTDLVIRPLGDDGRFTVKDPLSGQFFQFGPQEHFLLTQLDGGKSAEEVCAAFTRHFGEPLTEDELNEFLELVRGQGLLSQDVPAAKPKPTGQSLLHWRKKLIDPDRAMTWLAPRLWFFWTRTFLVASAGCIVLASLVAWLSRAELASSVRNAFRWETAAWAFLTLLVVGVLHEFAHGLTCKRFGGEVREIGFLLLFFMPCFYCNVSDAWLFKEKSKRLGVTLAGGWFELFLWSLAVFVWRLTLPGTWPHHLAFTVVTVCGVGTLVNFNPLIKLDGYYILSDWLEVPNLQQRAGDHLKAWLRWLLWGAERPRPEPRGRVLFGYGLASLAYSLALLAVMLFALTSFLGNGWAWAGWAAAVVLGGVALRVLLRGVSNGEVTKMLRWRHKRVAVWVLILGGVAAALCLIQIEDRATGAFQVRPAVRAELRAPVAGFVRAACCDEGERVSPGDPVVTLEVPELASRLAQKRAEVGEAEARLRLLKAGPRAEEVAEQRRRVERVRGWRDLAQQDLKRGRQTLDEELVRLDKQVTQCRAEADAAQDGCRRAQALLARQAVSPEECRAAETRQKVSHARLEQAQAERRACQANGTREAEAELARRANELADAEAALALLEAGTRPEEVEAETSRLARLREEQRFLEQVEGKLALSSPVAGVVTTPRLRDRVGQYVHEGDLICVVEEPRRLEVEIALAEQDVARVTPGQAVDLKARALAFETFAARVERVAPAACSGEGQGKVVVYCVLDEAPPELRPGMTGHARVFTGRRSLACIGLDRALRYVRSEFWW
jgi:multidrug resistance efflux pump